MVNINDAPYILLLSYFRISLSYVHLISEFPTLAPVICNILSSISSISIITRNMYQA